MPLIAILDSGINPTHPHVPKVQAGFNATAGGVPEDWFDRAGHGTAVAGAIHSLAPEAELLAIKIFDGGLRTNLDSIERGIEWALSRGADLINLSLGTTNEAHASRLAAWVERGAIWVSAAVSGDAPAYPGSLPGVVGVEVDPQLARFECRALGAMRFAASPYPREIPGVEPEHNLSGISFAVANVTGIIARDWARLGGLEVQELARELSIRWVQRQPDR